MQLRLNVDGGGEKGRGRGEKRDGAKTPGGWVGQELGRGPLLHQMESVNWV